MLGGEPRIDLVAQGGSGDRVLAKHPGRRPHDVETTLDASLQNTATDALGRTYAVDLVFHNAYGPDKAWFYDPALSGGGCVMDLGVHLVDLALWALDFPAVTKVSSTFVAGWPVELINMPELSIAT